LPDFDLILQAKTKQIQIKLLGFPWIPLAESRLFNGLRRIQIKNFFSLASLSLAALIEALSCSHFKHYSRASGFRKANDSTQAASPDRPIRRRRQSRRSYGGDHFGRKADKARDRRPSGSDGFR
jgi:hypothetical protein